MMTVFVISFWTNSRKRWWTLTKSVIYSKPITSISGTKTTIRRRSASKRTMWCLPSTLIALKVTVNSRFMWEKVNGPKLFLVQTIWNLEGTEEWLMTISTSCKILMSFVAHSKCTCLLDVPSCLQYSNDLNQAGNLLQRLYYVSSI